MPQIKKSLNRDQDGDDTHTSNGSIESSSKIRFNFKFKDPETGQMTTTPSPSDRAKQQLQEQQQNGNSENERKRKAERVIKRPNKKRSIEVNEQQGDVSSQPLNQQQLAVSSTLEQQKIKNGEKMRKRRARKKGKQRLKKNKAASLPLQFWIRNVLPFREGATTTYFSNAFLNLNKALREAIMGIMDVNDVIVPELLIIYEKFSMPIITTTMAGGFSAANAIQQQQQRMATIRFGQRVISTDSLMRAQLWKQVLQVPPQSFSQSPLNIRDYDVAIQAVKFNGLLLGNLDDILRNDFDVVRTALHQNGLAFQFVQNPQHRKNTTLLHCALHSNGLAIQFFDQEFRDSVDCAQIALKQNAGAFQFLGSELQKNPGIVKMISLLDTTGQTKWINSIKYPKKRKWTRQAPTPMSNADALQWIYEESEGAPTTTDISIPRVPDHLITLTPFVLTSNDLVSGQMQPAMKREFQHDVVTHSEHSLLNYDMTEEHLRQLISICLSHIILDHVRETLSHLVRPLRYCATTQLLRETIHSRIKDIINFWNCLEANEGLMRQRFIVEWILLVTLFYLCQAYKQRTLSVCSANFGKFMWSANVDAFVRFRLLDWHTEELIVAEKVQFFVYHPRNTQHIISCVLSMLKLNHESPWKDLGTPTSIFPNPSEALSTCKFDDFYLRCLLTFSVCTQEVNLVDIPLLTPMTRLLTFEDQLHVLSKKDFLYEAVHQASTGALSKTQTDGDTITTAQKHRYKKVPDSFDALKRTPAARVFSFTDLRRQFLVGRPDAEEQLKSSESISTIVTRTAPIKFPPSTHAWSQGKYVEVKLGRFLAEKQLELQAKAREFDQLSWVDSAQHEHLEEEGFNIVCCIDGCSRVAAENTNHISSLVYYDDLCGSYPLKQEIQEDPSKLRLVCKSHQQIDERRFSYGVAPSAEGRHTLTELVMRNALHKLPHSVHDRLTEHAEQTDHLDEDRKLYSIVEELEAITTELETTDDEILDTQEEDNSLLTVLIEYICKRRPSFEDEIRFLKSVNFYTHEQLVTMYTQVARMIQEEDEEFSPDELPEHVTLLEQITDDACDILPEHAKFLRSIATSLILPILRDYVTFRYYIILSVIRLCSQPLTIRNPHILIQILRYGQMDEVMDQMIQNFVVGEHEIGEELDQGNKE